MFIRKTQNSITKNPKRFWQYVNNKSSTHSLPNSMYYNSNNIFGGRLLIIQTVLLNISPMF
jgi:hypothetical protein